MGSDIPVIGTLHNVEIILSGDMNGREISGDKASPKNSPLPELSRALLRERCRAGLDMIEKGVFCEQSQMIEDWAGRSVPAKAHKHKQVAPARITPLYVRKSRELKL